jgi:hypothetical protein
MEPVIIFKDPHVVLKYDPVNHWISANWFGAQSMATIRDGCEQMLAGIKKYGCNKVLNDNRHVTGAWPDTLKWLEDDWFPRLAGSGCQYFAWVHSPDAASQVATQETIQLTIRNIKILIFDDCKTAETWLREV